MNANLPGVVVPPDMLAAMDEAARQGGARERSVELAARRDRASFAGLVQGVHIMAIGGEAEVPEILRRSF